MKKTLLTLSAVICLSITSHAQDLLTLGSAGFTIDGSSTAVNYSQTASALNWSGSQAIGDAVFGGTFSTINWSAVTQFGVKMTLSGSNPNLSFSLQLYDTSFNQALYSGTTDGLTVGVQGVVPVTLSTFDPGFNIATISGVGIQWDEAGTVTASMAAITAVPEPSTYALLALSGLALGGYAMRRRRRA